MIGLAQVAEWRAVSPKKENVSDSKALSSDCLRALQQRNKLIFGAPGHTDGEYITAAAVRGRKSGKPIETPISNFVQDQKRYLITPDGVVNWGRNLRAAAGVATLTRGRRTEQIQALELEPVAAATIFREAVRTGPDGTPAVFVRMYRHFILSRYLNVALNASLEEFEQEVLTHPVFLLESAI